MPNLSPLRTRVAELKAVDAMLATMVARAKAMGVEPTTIRGYDAHAERANVLWNELQAAEPLAFQAHGFVNRIAAMAMAIKKLKSAVEAEELVIKESH
eukprot:2104792-Pyramimonas_sp.AAC.2